MKNKVEEILKKYLILFPEEKQRQEKLMEFLNKNNSEEIIDWNNFITRI